MKTPLSVIAVILSVIALAVAGIGVLYIGEGPEGPQGPQGEMGPQGIAGLDATCEGFDYEWDGTSIRFMNPDGTWGDWVDLQGDPGQDGTDGSSGPAGPAGPAGPTGADGQDCEPNGLPVVTDITPEGCIGIDDDWIFSITVDDPEDDLMKIEFFIYVDTEWFDCECIPWLIGDHVWLPIFSEVGYDGTYSFDATNIKDMINWHIVEIPDCIDLMWRYEVSDRIVSDEPIYTPSCYLEDLCIELYNCCDGPCDFTILIDDIEVFTFDGTWETPYWCLHVDLVELEIPCCCDDHVITIVSDSPANQCWELDGQLHVHSITLDCVKQFITCCDETQLGWGLEPVCCEPPEGYWGSVWGPDEAEDGNWASVTIECDCGCAQ